MKLQIGHIYRTQSGLQAHVIRTFERKGATIFVAKVRQNSDEFIPVGYTEQGELLEPRHQQFALAI